MTRQVLCVFLILSLLCFIVPLPLVCSFFFFFNDTATTEIYTLSLHDALPISIFYGVESEARACNIKLIYRTLTDEGQPARQLTAFLSEMRPGGLLLVGPAELETVRAFQATGLPMVLVDHYLPDLQQPIYSVLGDNFQGTRLAMEYLFKM